MALQVKPLLGMPTFPIKVLTQVPVSPLLTQLDAVVSGEADATGEVSA